MANDTYHRVIVEFEILTEDTPWDGEVSELADDIIQGDCSGVMKIKSTEEVSSERMAKLLQAQGSDPGFFGLNEDGSPVDEDSPSGPV